MSYVPNPTICEVHGERPSYETRCGLCGATFRPLAECADEANEETIYDPARRLAGDAWRSDTPRPR